jgi:hypothetical protein
MQQQSQSTESVPIDIDTIHQQGKQQQAHSLEASKPSHSAFLQKMKGKCFGCGSSDHSKADGNHDRDICCHCKKKGHCSNVCFAKYMGKEAVVAIGQMG